MKKMKKRTISILISFAMMITLLPITVYALGDTANVGDASTDGQIERQNQMATSIVDDTAVTVGNITDLNAAIANVAEGGTIQLTGNITGEATIQAGNDKNFTLDLNSHSLTSSLNKTIIHNGTGTVTIIDTGSGGTVENTASEGNAIYNNATGNVNISSGTVTATATNGVAIYNNATGNVNISGGTVTVAASAAIFNLATGNVNISSGTVTATATNGVAIYNNATGNVNISGGMVTATATSGSVIFNAAAGNVNISGGTASATSGNAIHNNSTGKIAISGGEITATTGVAIHNNGTGKITISGDARVISANTILTSGTIYLASVATSEDILEITGGIVENIARGGNAIHNNAAGNVNISGGKVTATQAQGYAIYNYATGNVNISGGEVTTTAANGFAIYNYATGNVNISGGMVTATATSGSVIFNAAAGNVNISGGEVTTTAVNGYAIYNNAAGNVNISGGEVTATAANGYAIYNNATGKVFIPSGNAIIKGGNMAMNKAPDFTGYTNPKIVASTNFDGSSPVEYKAEDILSYKYIGIGIVIPPPPPPPPPSGGGSHYIPSPSKKPTTDAVVTGGSEVKATLDSKGSASVLITEKSIDDAIDEARRLAKENRLIGKMLSVTINVKSSKDTKQVTAILPTSIQNKLISENVESFTIKSDTAALTLDKNAIVEISKQAKADVSIAISKLEPKDLPSAIAKIVDKRPAFKVSISYGKDKVITSLGDSTVTLTIPYTLADGELVKNLHAISVDTDKNTSEFVSSKYVAGEKELHVKSSRLSSFVVSYLRENAAVPNLTGSVGGNYLVKSGDSFWKIANDHKVSMTALVKANNRTISSLLRPGDSLIIPAK